MILNNETDSLAAYEIYEAVKQKWYENGDRYQPTLFAVSELPKTPYETTRLKRYLTGIAGANRKYYYYPILAFIEAGAGNEGDKETGRPRKYVMSHSIAKTRQNIERWVESVHEHIVLKKAYLEGEEQLYEWFNEDLDERRDDSVAEEEMIDDEVFYIKKQDNWMYFLSEGFREPFFVYFTWRFDVEMQQRESDLVLWWEDGSSDDKGPPPQKQIKLMVHLLHSVDLPPLESLSLEYVPSLVYVDERKKMEVVSGVTDLSKMQ